MHTIFYSTLLIVGVGFVLSLLSNRKEQKSKLSQSCCIRMRSLRNDILRVKFIESRREDLPSIQDLAVRCEHFLDRAAKSLERNHPEEACNHLNLVTFAMMWVDFVLENPNVDRPRDYNPHESSTDRLASGLHLLEIRDHSDAEVQFEEELIDEESHFLARRVAVMGRLYINALLGHSDKVAEDERLLMMMP